MSATTVKNNTRTFVAGEALDAYLLVDIESDGSVTKASETSTSTQIGYTIALCRFWRSSYYLSRRRRWN